MDLYTPEQMESSEPQGFHAVMRFLRVVSRHRMVLIGCIAAGALLGFVRFSRIPMQYDASTRLMVSQRASSSANGNAAGNSSADLAGYRQLILSDQVLTDTV